MSFFKPDPPQPPNPVQVAGAQTATNIGTATANAFLNNVNQITPQGSLTYDQTNTYTFTDPNDGKTYNIPRFTATQNLSPVQQYISDLQGESQTNLAEMAVGQSGSLQNILGTPFNPAQGNFSPTAYLQANPDVMQYAQERGWNPTEFAFQHWQQNGQYEGRNIGSPTAPQGGDQSWLNMVPWASGDIHTGGWNQAGEFGDAGAITRSYGPADDFSSDRSRVEQAMFERVNPQLQQDEARLRQQLADQGIRYGSQAYEDAMRNYSNRVTDTRLGITAQGGVEQQRLMDMAAKRAGFENEAQMQQYQQLLGRGQFKNAAQQQWFAQQAARMNAANNAIAQNQARQQSIFNAANAQRNQYMQEQYMQRNQPLNEITSLLSGSQIQQPQWLNTPSSQIPTTDIAGLLNNRFTQDMAIYNQQNQNFQQLMGGIFGAIGGLSKSDVRAKENITPVGTVFAADSEGDKPLPIYSYSFKGDPAKQRRVGPMAQDVEKIAPRAVTSKRGVKYIDKTKLGSILRAA